MANFYEWLGGARIFGASKSRWFNPSLQDLNGTTISVEGYTNNYKSGNPPWNVTLETFVIDPFGNLQIRNTVAKYVIPTSASLNASSYEIGADTDLVEWTSAHGNATNVDINAAIYSDNGKVTHKPKVLVSNIANLRQVQFGVSATYGSTFVVVYGTYDAAKNDEVISYKTFDVDGKAVAGGSGRLLDSKLVGSGYDGFAFGTLASSGSVNPAFIWGAGYTSDGGTTHYLQFQVLNTDMTARGSVFKVPELVPKGATSQYIDSWTFDRLSPTKSTGNNFLVVMADEYEDAKGVRRYTLDVHTMNTTTRKSVDDSVTLKQSQSTAVAETRLLNGGFVVAYGDSGTEYLRQYDNAGHVVGGSYALAAPGGTSFKLSGLGDGRLLVEWRTDTESGNQVNYDIYDTRTAAIKFVGDGGNDQAAGTKFNDVFTTGKGHDSFDGAAGIDTFNVSSAPVLIDGGAGTDTIHVMAHVTFAAGSVVNVEAFTVANGASADLSLLTTGEKITSASASTGSSVIVGTSGDDTITGGAGTDRITGGHGADQLKGGGGKDIFTFAAAADSTSAAGGRDTILDFSGSQGDRLDFVAFGTGTTLSFNENSAKTDGVLTVTRGSLTSSVLLDGNFLATAFATASDGHGGTSVTYAPPTVQAHLAVVPS